MNEHTHIDRVEYYAQAESWNRDRLGAIRSSQRVAWWVAAVAAAIAILEATALVLLTPLKTVEPYTLMVDRTTGYVQALKPLDPGTVSVESALSQSFLVQYVVAREGFDLATFQTNYRKVALFSIGPARSSYLEVVQASSPQSPLRRYPRSTTLDVTVKSVSPIAANTALVRFDTTRTDSGAQQQPATSWVAVIRYRYSGQPMSLRDRFVNPLGFQVTAYRKDPETPPAADASSPSAAPGFATSASHYPTLAQGAPALAESNR